VTITGSDFALKFLKSSQNAWEEGAVQAALSGDVVPWPMVEVPLSVPGTATTQGHTGSVFVASDVFSVGTRDNFLRLPLAPIAAQRIANILGGFLLPTRKLSQDIYNSSSVKVAPLPLQNKGPNLPQYVNHNQQVQAQIDAAGGKPGQLIGGHKKDVVIWANLRPGKVGIFGWFKLDGQPANVVPENKTRIQPLFDGHDDHYADYSHGIRFVSPDMTLDGKTVKLEDVLKDSKLAGLVSDEGPLKTVRYPTPKNLPGGNPTGSGSGGSPSGPGGPVAVRTPNPEDVAIIASLTRYALGLRTILSWGASV